MTASKSASNGAIVASREPSRRLPGRGARLRGCLRAHLLVLLTVAGVAGAASLDPAVLGRLGGWAMLTTLLASSIGVGLAFAIQPGAGAADPSLAQLGAAAAAAQDQPRAKQVVDSFLDLVSTDDVIYLGHLTFARKMGKKIKFT